jgi:glycerophosphoryl diester phosphodiesterase
VEFDVRMTKDRQMVILHDATVDRTTDGEGNIWELTLTEVKQLHIVRTIPHPAEPATAATTDELERAGQVTDLQIPTLAELLDYLPANLELNIHTYPGPEDKELVVAGVVGEIQRRGLLQTAFIAGDYAVMHEAIRLEPKIRRCLLGATQNQAEYIAECIKLGCDICQPNWSIVSPELCNEAHAASIRVNPFWGDEVPEMERMLDAGVDGMLTNYPALLSQVLQRRGVRRQGVRASL